MREELGGLVGLLALLDALAPLEMAAIVDHVPNHVAVGRAELNPRWWAMLRDGPGSPAADWFDVDWDAFGGRVLLPVLGAPLDELVAGGEVQVVSVDGGELGAHLRVGAQRFPLAAGTEELGVVHAPAAQHYDLRHWRDPQRNVRRFFTIDDLVAVRVEDPAVALAVDTVPQLLAEHQAFAGVRVDHVDGLADPAAYLAGLRRTIGDDRLLLVEKILAPGEQLPHHWPVDGTTGYEHIRVLEQAMLDRRGFASLASRWAATTGDARPYRELELQARREVLDGGLRPDVERVARAAVAAGVEGRSSSEFEDVAAAVIELSAQLGRYRTYLPLDATGAEALRVAYAASVVLRPELASTLDQLVAAIVTGADADDELRVRWQQLTGPATAKGVEDRAFFRYLPLTTLCEVGGDPSPPEDDDAVAALHAWHAAMQERWPATMLAGTTHDTKRSEDVRSRGLAVAAAFAQWDALYDQWTATHGEGIGVDAGTRWLALQTALTAGPLSVVRLHEFLLKASREAAIRTSWADHDDDFEAALGELASTLVAWRPLADAIGAIDADGRARSLALLAVRLTAPGFPDVYQGTEAFRFVLTDPDNRVEPDHDALDELVARAADLDGPAAWAEPAAPAARAVVIRRVLAARRSAGALTGYQPLTVVGPDAAQVVAFARTDADGTPALITAVTRCGAAAVDATLPLPRGDWRLVLDDAAGLATASLALGPMLSAFPASVLAQV